MTEQTSARTYLESTRTSYDTVAADYAELLADELAAKPLDRAILGAFAEVVGPKARAAELGCGPGRVTAHLRGLGLEGIFGIDLSPGMVEVARQRHPDIRFEVGSMTELDLPDASLDGAVAWYSTVHTPPELLPTVFAEIHRVLAPGGRLLLAFKAGDLHRKLSQGYGHDVDLDVYWLPPDQVAALLTDAGFTLDARLVRAPHESERAFQGEQAFFVATHSSPEAPTT
ncbi:class I SAM-dependent DNA methyltransferase [Streptacidiphilus fuscans]|uniref:Class I SAM-dependent methyltransferase n=1 Tax=Streptacidiphilus fuscans TaxID=2789292 RepID=A0A931BBM1_9ACTN|nr:class I SAM-dependent methyltransferase [Streptacidiphilus fuscans]MBF9072267.1 class I SAM-dependent methyltransferase [Streptacidiphilus fuscans]